MPKAAHASAQRINKAMRSRDDDLYVISLSCTWSRQTPFRNCGMDEEQLLSRSNSLRIYANCS